MKDIFEILKDLGITVPEDKHKDLRRSLNENYIVIDEHKTKLEKVNGQLTTANETITNLKTQLEDASKVDVKALQDKIKEFEDAEADRVQKENAARELEALKARFAPLKGENKFLNEGTENWMFEEFTKALTLDDNKGKSDKDIFEAITKDKNIYENPNQKFVNPPAGGGKEQNKAEFKRFF
ncbi:MAG: hypothetical protein IKL52_00250 [Candidatus Gastranaerophilales bacterium]|nr:hypothetical protein [Candidatus Gastranaerophilales bacterium]